MKPKRRKPNLVKDALKQIRKENRENEIKAHGKPISRTIIQKSSKTYKRDKRVDLDDL